MKMSKLVWFKNDHKLQPSVATQQRKLPIADFTVLHIHINTIP